MAQGPRQLSAKEINIVRAYYKELSSRLDGPELNVPENVLTSTYRYDQIIELAGDCPEDEIPKRAAQARFGYLVGLHVEDELTNSTTSQTAH